MRFIVAFLLVCSASFVSADRIPLAINLALEAEDAETHNMVYLLYVTRPACPYCKKLENNVLYPMRVSGTYADSVYLREISFEGGKIIDFDQQVRSSIDIVRRFGVTGSPTLLFLDATGAEVTKRIVGYYSEDFYWYYFEQSIKAALKSINPSYL